MTQFVGISTLSTLDASQLKAKALDYGLDKINIEIEKCLSAYNSQVSEIMSDFAQPVDVQDMVLEVGDGATMQKLNELGEPVTKRDSRKIHVGFPLERYGTGEGYSVEWLNRATVAEVNRRFLNAQIAHQKSLVKLAAQAMVTSASATVVERYGDGNTTVTVQPFWNGNDTPPANSAGTKFAKSHTHYNAVAASGSPTNAEITALVNTVLEHDETEEVILVIHADDFATISALTDFTALTPSKIVNVLSATADRETGTEDQSNRLCGYWKSMWPVFIRPFAVSGYVICLNIGSTLAKPLGYRQSKYANEKGLIKQLKNFSDPMIIEQFFSYEGFGVINRSAGAVLQISATSYSTPTL